MCETLYTLALSRLKGLNLRNALLLYRTLGSATAVIEERAHLTERIPGLSSRLTDILNAGIDAALARAERELAFAAKYDIRTLCLDDADYPHRLRQAEDAPLALFYQGTADLNAAKIVSVVGTRRCTEYGKDLCQRFAEELHCLFPDTLIISGLAYGIDIHAHRAALDAGLPTVGVFAHGLDRIYPALHRATAKEMLQCGGLLTEFMSETTPEKMNFVQRNRIIAGLCDACLVVESSEKGGSLITAELAQDYGRDVFAFPGRVGDPLSTGCNGLIKNNRAALILSASDLTEAMLWQTGKSPKQPRQQELFPSFTPEEEVVAAALHGSDGKHINELFVATNLSVSRLTTILFELEMKGAVKALNGGRYRPTLR